MSKIADQMFDASHALAVAEEAFIAAAERIVGAHEWWVDLTWDYYDRSFEFHGVAVGQDLTDDQLTAFAALGFDRCWLNYKDGTERSYSCSPPRRGEIRPGRSRGESFGAIERIIADWGRRGPSEERASVRAWRAIAALHEVSDRS